MPIVLYHHPFSRASTVVWMLEEVGVPYELRWTDLMPGEHEKPELLALNPMGKLPVLVEDGTVVTETAAIGLYLADRHAPGRSRPRSTIRGVAPTRAGLHEGAAGGCWWPRGRGGRAPVCTLEMFEDDTCRGTSTPCTTPRGCEPIDVDERTSGTPPPVTDEIIVTRPPPVRDGGADAPVPDAPPADVPRDTPRDVPPDVPEDVVVM